MAELMFPDIGGSFLRGQVLGTQQRQQREADQRRNRLADLAGQAWSASPDQRSALIGQAVGVDPEAGMALAQGLSSEDDRRNQSMVYMAKLLTSAPEQYRPGLYQQMMPSLQRMGMSQLPPQYDDTVAQAAQSIVSAYAGANSGGLAPRVVGNALVDHTGNVLYQAPDEPKYQWSDARGAWIPHPGNASTTPSQPAGSYEAEDGTTVPLTRFTDANGNPVDVDAGVDPHALRQILSQPDAFAAAPDGAVANMPPVSRSAPATLRAIPVEGAGPRPESRDVFSMLSSDEVQQMGLPAGTVAQRNLTTGRVEVMPAAVQPGAGQANKPMPVSALRMLQDSREALSVSSGIDSEIGAIYNDLASGNLQLGPLSNWIARGRNAVGISTEESRRFQTMMNTFEKMRNDSLRLNKGVQTEGDAQRAWNELFGNLSDTRNVMGQLERIRRINERAITLHEENIGELEANYGRERQSPATPTQRLRFNPATGRIE